MSRNFLGVILDFWGLISMIGYCAEGTLRSGRRSLQNSAEGLGTV